MYVFNKLVVHKMCTYFWNKNKYLLLLKMYSKLGVDRLSAPILSILPIIDIGHFQNRFADNFYFYFLIIFLLCKQTYYLQVTLFIGE